MVLNGSRQRVLHALLLVALLVAARPAAAQYGMDFSVYSGIEWDGDDVHTWVDGYDNSWGCNHFDYAPWTQLSSPTRLTYGGSSSFLPFDGEEGVWGSAGGFTFMCSCVYSYVGAGPVQLQQELRRIPSALQVFRDFWWLPPPNGQLYNRERHYQVLDQFNRALERQMQLEEFYDNVTGNCQGTNPIETGSGATNSSGQFKDNYSLGVGAPNPCETTATQLVILDGHRAGTYSVTWTYNSVGIQ